MLVKKESNKIIETCFDTLNTLPILPRTPRDTILKEGLTMLANQAQAIPLQITAAGFFPVDLTMLGFIIGSITSYFIVILQFIQATNSTRALENGEH